jgi:enamine deaminase RidA (YjgF/YER057c/UK114 family)
MQPDLILQEEDFCLEFRSISKFISMDKFPHRPDLMVGDDGYVLQERIIMPPHMIGQANDYSAKAIAPLRCNEPLIFIGHPDLPVQYASIIARQGKGKSKVEKSDAAIKITADGINLLYSAPIFSGEDGHSFITAFDKISEVLQSFSMQESAIARTWLYMQNILRDYDILNKAREQFFQKWFSSTNTFIPASTGINGHIIGDRLLSIEFCAFSGENVKIKQILSPLQNEPTAYGKLFSRAVVVGFPKSQLLFISGTAAIDKTGLSVHVGNFENQMAFTLEVISAILNQEKGSFSNVAQAIVHLKRSEDMGSCLRIFEAAGFPSSRALFQLDVAVCRDNLLCEIEVTAVITL